VKEGEGKRKRMPFSILGYLFMYSSSLSLVSTLQL
jgi:hypothetical protein